MVDHKSCKIVNTNVQGSKFVNGLNFDVGVEKAIPKLNLSAAKIV